MYRRTNLAPWLVCISVLCLWLLSSHSVQAADAPATLQSALTAAVPPATGVAMAVGAEVVTLPLDTVLPGVRPSVAGVASEYGRVAQHFGVVLAVAPPTMTVLNTAPGEPNIYVGMPPLDAFTLLAASLSSTQWSALTSESGLAVSDLNPQQQMMFSALLSHDGKLLVVPQYALEEKPDDHDQRDLTGQILQTHLRMGQTIALSLPPKDQPGTYYSDAPIPPAAGSPRRYQIGDKSRQDYGGSADVVYGAQVRADLPNVPKQGQLDFSASGLEKIIPLSGMKTVGDLVYRIGRMTGTELYVDKRTEDRSLTLLGAVTAPAADLLRSLAFCLTGTYRQVGPAYVLTDDIVGIGTRRQIWSEFEAEADDLRRAPVDAARNALYTQHPPRSLPWFGDPGVYSPEQEKAVSESVNTRDAFLPELKLPLSQLTPAQQEMARRGVDEWNKEYSLQPVSTDGTITVRPGLSTQLLVPGLDAPVDLNLNHGPTEQYFLFQMPQDQVDALIKADGDQRLKAHPEWADMRAKMSMKAPLGAVWASLASAPQRAAVVHPHTAGDVDAEVAAAKTLGLNELWLDVFSGGAAHIPGSALSPASPLPHGENDILTEALLKTRGTGMKVFPTLDLLFWGPAPPEQDADRNLLGETSAQAAARWQQLKALLPAGQKMSEEVMSNAVIPDWPGVAVSPLSPDVRTALSRLVRVLSIRPGVAGLVLRDTDTPGYDLLPGGSDTSSLLLGYQEDARLAFLRRFHADPVDIYDVGHSATMANTDLPNFSDNGSGQETYRLHDDWVQFRQDTGLEFLRMLYAAANPPGTPLTRRVRILVKQRRQGQPYSDHAGHDSYPPGWYGSWDDPRQPPPTLHAMGEDDKPGQPSAPVADETTQAHLQSQIVMTPITADGLDQMRFGFGLRRDLVRTTIPGQRGAGSISQAPSFVLDLDDASGNDPVPAKGPLTALAAQVVASPMTGK